MAHGGFIHTKPLGDRADAKLFDDGGCKVPVHAPHDVVKHHICQVGKLDMQTRAHGDMFPHVTTDAPYADIGQRLEWHRTQVAELSQGAYAETINVKRATYTHWERGTQRLSLNGALSLRKVHGLSLDWLYTGSADTLSMALRNAWLSRSRVNS